MTSLLGRFTTQNVFGRNLPKVTLVENTIPPNNLLGFIYLFTGRESKRTYMTDGVISKQTADGKRPCSSRCQRNDLLDLFD